MSLTQPTPKLGLTSTVSEVITCGKCSNQRLAYDARHSNLEVCIMSTQMTWLVILSNLQVHDLMTLILSFLCSVKHTENRPKRTSVFAEKVTLWSKGGPCPSFLFLRTVKRSIVIDCSKIKCTASFFFPLHIPQK